MSRWPNRLPDRKVDMFTGFRRSLAIVFAAALTLTALHELPASAQSSSTATVLHAAEAGKLLPGAVFFKGQSAPVQARNSGGIKFQDGSLLLATLVDNSGYSTAVQQKYQTYLIAETAVLIGGHLLPPGAYGTGFVSGHFMVMDIGGHDMFTVDAVHDADLKRPTPLQILADTAPEQFRLYQGRDYVMIASPPKQ
jgi:hypothetical protein